MPRTLALCIFAIVIVWLFYREHKTRPMSSWGLMIPFFWVIIIGSTLTYILLGTYPELQTPDTLLEGSPLDRNILLFLITCGAITLFRRRPDWYGIFRANRWFFAFLIYCGISIIWSDYPFVSFKRYIKELGNIVMSLILLTENDPVQATKAVFARYTYFVIPASVISILYSPEIGTYYLDQLSEISYRGVGIDKNALGVFSFICGLFLIWDLVHAKSTTGRSMGAADLLVRWTLLLAVAWLMYISNSKTPLVCLVIGTCILIAMRSPLVKRQVRYLGTYSLAFGSLAFLNYAFPGIPEAFLGMLGRDATFTGRTDIWHDVLKEQIHPLVGTGYQSFWLGSRADYLWQKYLFNPTQAHNGYLETYLNGGLLGLCLLMAALMHTACKLKRQLLLENSFGILLFAVLVAALFYNMTEAMFGRFNLFWLVLCLAALYFPTPHTALPEELAPAGPRHRPKTAP